MEKVTAAVWSGAGAKVILQAGMAKAFVESGLECKYTIGASAGALTAACLHAGQVGELLDLCMRIKNKDVYSLAPWKLLTKEASVYDNAPLRKTIKSILNCERIRQNKRSCIAKTTDMAMWQAASIELTVLSDEEMIDTLVTSAAVPLAFPCVNRFCDGGVIDDYPILDALIDKVDRVIVFTAAKADPHPVNGWKTMLQEFLSISMYNQLAMQLSLIQLLRPELELIVVAPDTNTMIGLLDFNSLGSLEQRKAYIDIGYAVAKAALSSLH